MHHNIQQSDNNNYYYSRSFNLQAEVMVKFTSKVKGPFVTLIKISIHLIECISGHTVTVTLILTQKINRTETRALKSKEGGLCLDLADTWWH